MRKATRFGLIACALLAPAGGRAGEAYDPGGRRDPFVDPIRVIERGPGPPLATSLAGMTLGEVRLAGISRFGTRSAAILLGSDGIGYFAREGDEMADARVLAIDFARGTVVFLHETSDPLLENRWLRVEWRLGGG